MLDFVRLFDVIDQYSFIFIQKMKCVCAPLNQWFPEWPLFDEGKEKVRGIRITRQLE